MEGLEPVGKKNADDAVRAEARRAAELAERVGAQDPRALRKAFRRTNLEVYQRSPDHHYVHQYFGHGAKKLRVGLHDEEFLPVATEVREHGRTYLYYNRLYTLHQAVRNVARLAPDELCVLEVGVYLGGSAYFLARVAEHFAQGRVRLSAVDTFAGHSELDLPDGFEGAHTLDKFRDVQFDEVRQYLSVFGFVDVVHGRIQDVADRVDHSLHLVHIDVDIYEPTTFALGLAADRLVLGGIAIVDDYGFTTCPGARRAVDEFRHSQGDRFATFGLDTGQALIIRTR